MKTYFSDVVEYDRCDSDLRGVLPFGNPADTIALYKRMECIAAHRILEFTDPETALDDKIINELLECIEL